MEPQTATPLAIDNLLLDGFKLFKMGFMDVLGILLSQTLSLIILFVGLFSITMSFYGHSTLTTLPVSFIISMVISILIILMVQLGFVAAFTTKFWAIAHQNKISSSQAYRLGIRKALPLLVWMVIYLLIVWTGLLLFFVPGLVLATSLFMGAALIIQDHHTCLGAVKTSHKMVWPYLRQTLFYIVVAAGITLGLYFVTLYPLGLFVSYLTSNYPMLNGILDIARYALIVMLVPLFVALMIPYYMALLRLAQNQTAS